MAHFMLLSDRPQKNYEAFLLEGLEELRKHTVRGLAVVALLEPDEEGEAVLTGYFNMSLQDKELAAANIQADVVDGILRANIKRYLEELEDE